MKNKKSQITIFIIIGLVLIVVVGLLYYLSTLSSEGEIEEEARSTEKIKPELQAVENFVTQCLEVTAKEGLTLLGKQGGYIYRSQGGVLVDFREDDEGLFYIKKGENLVSYSIFPLRQNIGNYYFDAPEYPYIGFPSEGPEGLFGINTLPTLNQMKSNLKNYIENNLADCIDDFQSFTEYDITGSDFDVVVEIARSDVTFNLKYPLQVVSKINQDTVNLDNFFIKENVRLQKIREVVNNLIERDNRDIEFDISNPTSLEPGFNVDIARSLVENDDLITITDTDSLVNGRAFEFSFSRQNRRPALHQIDDSGFTFDGTIIEMEDVLSILGVNTLDELPVSDPDEDVVFQYSIYPVPPRQLSSTGESISFEIRVDDEEGLRDYQVITIN